MLLDLAQAPVSELVKRLALASEDSSSWMTVVTDTINETQDRMVSELRAIGRNVVPLQIRLDPQDFLAGVHRYRGATLSIAAGDEVDAACWRRLDSGRSELERDRPTLLLATEKAIEALFRSGPHICSFLGSSAWQAQGREQVAALVRALRVADARRLASQLTAEELGPWQEVLAPPTMRVRPASGRADFSANMRWIRDNKEQVAGKWVAMGDGRMIDCDESRRALQERLSTRDDLKRLLLVLVER